MQRFQTDEQLRDVSASGQQLRFLVLPLQASQMASDGGAAAMTQAAMLLLQSQFPAVKKWVEACQANERGKHLACAMLTAKQHGRQEEVVVVACIVALLTVPHPPQQSLMVSVRSVQFELAMR
jgi:hypothetical protein